MFGLEQLAALRERKQALRNDAAVNRCLLAIECDALQQRLGWVNTAFDVSRRILPFLSLVGPLWRGWREKREAESSWFGKIAAAIPLALRVAELLKSFRERRDDDQTTADRL